MPLAPRAGGAGESHSRDVSGWVCLRRLQEEPSTCPRNAAGTCLPPPPPCSLRGEERESSGGKGILLRGRSPAGGRRAPVDVGETALSTGTSDPSPGRVGHWVGRVRGSGGNQGSSPEGWLPGGPDSRWGDAESTPRQMLALLSRMFREGACSSNYSPFPRTPETWLPIQAQPPT